MPGTPILENLIQFIPQVKGSGFNQLNKGIMSTHRNLFSLRNMFTAFFGYDLYSSIRNAIPAMIDTSRQLGAIHARLFAATGSAKGANQEFSWLLDTTKKLGLELMTTSDRYSLFAAASKQIFSEKETRQIFERVLKLQRVLHMPAEKMSNIYYTMQRMSSEGTLKSRDFLSLQLIPGAFPIAQRAAGFKEGKNGMLAFRKAMRANEIDIKTFLPKFTKELEKQYVTADKLKEAMDQVDAQLQLAQRYAQGFQMALAKAGFQKDLISTLKVLNIGLSFLETHAHGIYQGLKLLVKLFVLGIGVNSVLGVIKLVNEVKNLNAAILTFQALASSMGILAGGSGAIGAGAGIVGGMASGGMLGGLIAFIINPWVWVPLAIAAISAVLIFVLKKFFPNVWSEIMSLWIRFKILVWNLIDDINNHPAIKAMKQWFGTEKTGFAKDVQDKQKDWSQMFPNHQFVFNVGGALDAANMWAYNKAMNLTPLTRGMNLARQVGPALTKYIIEQKYKIDVKVDGVEDKKTIMDSVHDAISNFAEQNKKKSAMDIINSTIFNKKPFS